MPLIIPPGFSHVALEFRHFADPDPWYCTYGIDSGAGGGDVLAMGLKQLTAWTGTLLHSQSPEVALTGVQITVGQDGAEPIRAYVASTIDRPGTSSEEKLPQNCALLIRKNTGVGGRRSRGRLFVPGALSEGNVSNVGIITPFTLGEHQDRAGDWLAELASAVVAPATPMFLLHSTGISATIDPTEVTSLTVDGVISTQRRRLR